MPNEKHPIPKTERERRMRIVQLLRVEAGEIDPPASAVPTRRYGRAARRRIVEAMAAEMGLPPPRWVKRTPRAETIHIAPIKGAWDRSQRERHRRYEAVGLALEDDARRVRCRRCGETLMDVPNGMIGVTPSALYVMHAQRTGCR